ncbi:bifunctional adenosylcobinamide kinase/adenosylcobinamide-phosphate guanylyltransferase [Candidatus Manganitrophus noduliformans]|uniref:Adenosylcobinamide kinase n=1 Tax=Candidatus Manganitrophus noduliformans TaxID=2606439 RepID=A0A7X6DRB5_9BACT|nr:bifunctional adenosylcobinamide kinase/adenosylcobinamide-phosphate guanylyltransferase [Candidatus Manganitrophus noduliformans]NKE71915.1 bifunctional adenosylcobinamide kinase/adenosylcobinamide-phosphate guanylyltransferase [Candidatus Manganitrophus noduliformans]
MERKDLSKSRLILILGGARSGKSRFALERGETLGEEKIFIATARPSDAEMARRIERHRRDRPEVWKTMEEPIHLADLLQSMQGKGVAVIDCLTLWLSNLLTTVGEDEEKILSEIDRLVSVARSVNLSIVAVSNEVGLGVVPTDHSLSRLFRDLSGLLHQRWAAEADEVYWMMAGIAVPIKRKRDEKVAVGHRPD